MPTSQNQVSQKVSLDAAQYRSELRKMTTDVKSGVNSINRDLQSSGTAFQDYANTVRQNGAKVVGQAAEIGKSFSKYVGKGALVMGGIEAVSGFTRAVRSTADTGLAFGKSLAQMAQRADLTADKIEKLRKRFYELGSSTGATLQSLPVAAQNILGAVGGNMDQAMDIMTPIAKAAGAENGDAESIAEQVKDILKGEGKKVTTASVTELLQSGFLAKSGGDFASLDEYLQARLAGVEGVAGRARLSDREQAAMLAAATQTGQNKENSVAGLQALIRSSVTGLGGGAALAGLLGIHGRTGFLTNGKFDVSKLNTASAYLNKRGMNEADLVQLLSGVTSGNEAQGIYALLKGNSGFQSKVKTIEGSTQTFDEAVGKSTDDVSDDLRKLQNSIVKATDQIFAPAGRVINAGYHGGLGSAAAAAPGAVADSLKAVYQNKGLVAGGLAMAAISGVLSKKLGLFGGVMVGDKLKQMGVQPVYVTNASEIAGKYNDNGALAQMEELAGGSGAAGATKGTWLSRLAAILGSPETLMAGGAIGAGAFGAYAATHPQGRVAELTREAAWDPDAPPGMMEHKVKVEVTTKDPGLLAIPKSTDKATKARGL